MLLSNIRLSSILGIKFCRNDRDVSKNSQKQAVREFSASSPGGRYNNNAKLSGHYHGLPGLRGHCADEVHVSFPDFCSMSPAPATLTYDTQHPNLVQWEINGRFSCFRPHFDLMQCHQFTCSDTNSASSVLTCNTNSQQWCYNGTNSVNFFLQKNTQAVISRIAGDMGCIKCVCAEKTCPVSVTLTSKI